MPSRPIPNACLNVENEMIRRRPSLFFTCVGSARSIVIRHAYAGTGTTPPPPWHVLGLPNTQNPLTTFDIIGIDNRQVLRVQADHSYANLVHELAPAVPAVGTRLSWRWRLDQPLLGVICDYAMVTIRR